MALEKTVLNENLIKDLLNAYYGLSVVSAKKLPLGSANCYCVNTGEKDYFLKEFQNGFSKDELVREAKLAEFLNAKSIPTAYFIPTDKGEYCLSYEDHIICLEEYIDGQTYGYDDFPESLLLDVARLLGKLHVVMRDCRLPLDMGDEWLDSSNADTLTAQYNKLIDLAQKHWDDKNYKRIVKDLEYKKEVALHCDKYKKYYKGITYSPTHGDFQGCQLICGKNEIKAIIDFSSARTLPITWEIMRSYVQTSKKCRQSTIFDIDEFCQYVREYMKYASLTSKDLEAMPYVYLLQLERSKYGYKEYLTTDSDDRDGLLAFAFWRTAIYREIESKSKDISDALLKLKEDIC